MRIATRRNAFETNSSSVHAIAVLGAASARRWRSGDALVLESDASEYEFGVDETRGDEARFVSAQERERAIWTQDESGYAPGIGGEADASAATGLWSYESAEAAVREAGNGGDVLSADLANTADGGVRFDVVIAG